MNMLDDRDLDRLLAAVDHQPNSWRLQLLRRRILAEVAEQKARPFYTRLGFEPALVAAMLLGLIIGSALPFDNLFDEPASIASVLQLSSDSFGMGG
jgi:hypothetical protein